jgi:uracil-DNA glycosylase
VRSARVAIIGEALGYRGGHFTGIPMTSERILLGRNSIIAATLCDRRTQTVGHRLPLQIIPMAPKQTSKRTLCRDGFSEPTATIVWAALLNAGLNPEQFVLWNAFPWHSFDPHSGMLSNRMPKKSECACGVVILKRFVELFSLQRFVALGRVAHEQLRAIGIEAQYVRHPASGGAKLFRQQIGQIVAAN